MNEPILREGMFARQCSPAAIEKPAAAPIGTSSNRVSQRRAILASGSGFR